MFAQSIVRAGWHKAAVRKHTTSSGGFPCSRSRKVGERLFAGQGRRRIGESIAKTFCESRRRTKNKEKKLQRKEGASATPKAEAPPSSFLRKVRTPVLISSFLGFVAACFHRNSRGSSNEKAVIEAIVDSKPIGF